MLVVVGSLCLVLVLILLLGSLFRAKLIILPAGRRVGEKESWLVIVAEEAGEFLLLKFGKFSKGLVFLLPPRVLLAEDGVRENEEDDDDDDDDDEGEGEDGGNTLSKLNP